MGLRELPIKTKEQYNRLSGRAGITGSICFVLLILLGASSDFLSKSVPGLVNFLIPLSGLAVFISAVTCIVAAICARLKRDGETQGVPNAKVARTDRSRAFWFLLIFFSLSLLATIFDQRIQNTPEIQGIGRTFGPLGAFLGAGICSIIAIRFREVRFLTLAILSFALLGFWVWRMVHL